MLLPSRRFCRTLLALCALATPLAAPAFADNPPESSAKWLAEHYTKYEYRIPMRDGVRLYTRVLVPKDDSQAWPILLTRTPYALRPYGEDNYSDTSGSVLSFAKDTFILVTQDVRGRFGSEGQFEHVRPFHPQKHGPQDTDESTDAWDTIDWLVKNIPNNNGNVGMYGVSYGGFYTSMGMIHSHPALKAVSPQAPIADWWVGDDIHHNGALLLVQNFSFMAWFDHKVDDPRHETIPNYNFGTEDGYDFFLRMGPLANSDRLLKGVSAYWREVLAHPNYDAYWQARDIRPHLRDIHCAVMTVGGWYDAEDLFGTLETYRRTEQQNPGITNVLVMGPWYHGGWARSPGDKLGDVDFRARTSPHYLEKIELPFFRRYLKGDTSFTPAEATIFETGSNRWRTFDSWPPKAAQSRTLYLSADGALAFTPPTETGAAYDEFISDPAKPVPYTMHRTTGGYARTFPVEDQSFATSRTDVLAYATPVLDEDLTIAGPMKVTLNVSTTGTDADFVVKIIDVYAGDAANPEPNPTNVVLSGYQQLVRGDVIRGRFRHSFEKPEPFVPGEVTKVTFTLPDICHNFRRGHRLMVHVQSSWFPLVDRNPQTFVDIATAKPGDFRKATERVYRSAAAPSEIEVLVLPR